MVIVAVRLASTSCDHYLHLVEVGDVVELCNKLDEINYEFEQGYIDDYEIAFTDNDDNNNIIGKWLAYIGVNLKEKKKIRDQEWRELNG